jgi:hypothetical protein
MAEIATVQQGERDPDKMSFALRQTAERVLSALQRSANLSDLDSARTARSSSGLNVERMTVVTDANYTILPTDQYVLMVSMSASRVWTLPTALGNMNPGHTIRVRVNAFSLSGAVTLTIQTPGGQLIGPSNASSVVLTSGSSADFTTDGGNWHMTVLGVQSGGTGANTPAGARGNLGAAAQTQTDFISGIIKTPANQDYRIVERLPYAVTFQRMTAKCASGSCTVTVKVNSTTIGNFSQAVGTGVVTTTSVAPNTAATADVIVVTISAAASPVDLSLTLEFTRTLAS